MTKILLGLEAITVAQLVGVWAALTLPWLAVLVSRPVLWARSHPTTPQDMSATRRRPLGLFGVQIVLLGLAILAVSLNPQHTLPLWLLPAVGLTQIGFLTIGAFAGWQGAPFRKG